MTGSVDSIVQFLEARIVEDETTAQAAIEGDSTNGKWAIVPDGHGDWVEGLYISAMDSNWDACISTKAAAHVVRFDPARALTECAAKRAIIDLHLGNYGLEYCLTCTREHGGVANPCPTIRHLATIYADHPSYQQEWAL